MSGSGVPAPALRLRGGVLAVRYVRCKPLPQPLEPIQAPYRLVRSDVGTPYGCLSMSSHDCLLPGVAYERAPFAHALIIDYLFNNVPSHG